MPAIVGIIIMIPIVWCLAYGTALFMQMSGGIPPGTKLAPYAAVLTFLTVVVSTVFFA